ncbi:MAG: tetratricopeptide repeat protein [Nodosilinea sp.]
METCVRDRSLSPSFDQPQLITAQRSTSDVPANDFERLRYSEMGKLFLEQGCYQESLAQFEQALTLDPHQADSWCGRADALSCLGRYEEALQSVEQAQALAGLANPRLWVQKAVLLIVLNQPKLALTCCNQALWRSPSHTQAWLFRGVALHRLGQLRAAYRSYQRVLQPSVPAVANSMRRLCQDLALDQQAST